MIADARPDQEPSDARRALAVIGSFLAVRLVAGWLCPAMVDEAYALVVSRTWSLSYFDHPPVCFTIARLVAWATGGENIFLARLPFVLAGAASAWLVYDVTRLAYGSRAGLWATCWFSVAPFFLVSAGHFVVPDGPLDLALLLTVRFTLPDLLEPGRPPRLGRWCAAGATLALAFASKYQASLFGVSALAFLGASPPHRRLFLAPALWLMVAISLVGIVPAVAWNATHEWASFGFQAGRIVDSSSVAIGALRILIVLAGQMLYLLPGTWLVILVGAVRGVVRPRTIADRLFGWLTILPPLLFLALAGFSRRPLPHWAMSGFLFGFPLVGDWSARIAARWPKVLERIWQFTTGLVAAAFLGFALQARAAIFTPFLAAVLPTADLDWQHQRWPALIQAWPGLGSPREVVVSDWFTAAKAAHALGPGVAVTPFTDPRHFRFLPRAPADAAAAPVLALEPADPGETETVQRNFIAALGLNGYEVAGEPRIIPQRTGDRVRFEIIAVPVRRRE